MEASFCNTMSSSSFPSSSSPSLKNHHLPNSSLSFTITKRASALSIRARTGPRSMEEIEREVEEWMETERGACGEGKSVVEAMEWLEREAIMGDDKGREPDDYNRRARIFDKSSKLFQALREGAKRCQDASSDSAV